MKIKERKKEEQKKQKTDYKGIRKKRDEEKGEKFSSWRKKSAAFAFVDKNFSSTSCNVTFIVALTHFLTYLLFFPLHRMGVEQLQGLLAPRVHEQPFVLVQSWRYGAIPNSVIPLADSSGRYHVARSDFHSPPGSSPSSSTRMSRPFDPLIDRLRQVQRYRETTALRIP